MTKQEFFDKTYKHFNSEGAELSKTTFGTCMYRLSGDPLDQIRCAIGVHIPDDKYDREMECHPEWDDSTTGWDLEKVAAVSGITIDEFDDEKDSAGGTKTDRFMSSIQTCHDRSESVDECLASLREFAAMNNLSIPTEV